MLKLTIEELSALNLLLQFMTMQEIINAAKIGFVDKDNPTTQDQEKSDLCWKVLKTLR